MRDDEQHIEDQENEEELEEGETCEEQDGCGAEETAPAPKVDAKKATAPAPAKPATPAATAVKYLYPFNVRYAAEILDLAGFTDGTEYTTSQVKEVLIQNGYTEFRDIDVELHHSAATNTLVITIKGSKKGAGHD